SGLHFRTPAHLARKRRQFSKHGFDEGRLAGTVRPDDAETFAASQGKRDVASERFARITDCGVHDREHLRTRALDLLQTKIARRLVGANSLNPLQLLQHLATRLRLLCLLTREIAAYELFSFGD